MNVVWLKRDLRLRDHAPLAAAFARGDVLVVYVVEPELVRQPETDPSHVAFVAAPSAGEKEPAGQAVALTDAQGQKNPAGHKTGEPEAQ